MMRLSERAINEIGRLLNTANNPQHPAIAHLTGAACRAAESLIYLADIDDIRFKGMWPHDGHDNAAVDDGHVRWAATGALTSLDLCVAAAGRLAGFARRPPRGEDSIREFYRVRGSTVIADNRHLVPPPWRSWMDNLVTDSRYEMLLRVRNTLAHGDALRVIKGSSRGLWGHEMRYGYNLGPFISPVTPSTHHRIGGREIVELSRDVSLAHVGAFVDVLESWFEPRRGN